MVCSKGKVALEFVDFLQVALMELGEMPVVHHYLGTLVDFV